VEEEDFADIALGIVVGSCDDAEVLRSERLQLVTVNVDGCCQSYDIAPTTRMKRYFIVLRTPIPTWA
jgi:hypothetical protein